MRVVYFAKVREMIGQDGESCAFPEGVDTVASAIDWLTQTSPRHAAAFADRSRLRFALDQKLVGIDASIADAEEFAIFPPVTGG